MKIKIDYLNRNILLGLVILIFIVLLIFSSSLLAKRSLFVWLLAIIQLGLILRIFLKRTNKFISGFVGEKDIEIELKSLGEEFIRINGGLDTGRGNIDKIVLGPTGAWALEVKSHMGYITFDGNILLRNGKPFEKDFLKQAYAEAKTLEDLIRSKLNIEIKVQPVVVFSNKFAKVRLGRKPYKGVYVIRKEWLNKLITGTHNQALDNETISKIKSALNF